MNGLPLIDIADYSYRLPDDRIASYPLNERDASGLLVATDNALKKDTFYHISRYLPENSLLVMNNTKVVQARLIFHKSSGARIEVFCLSPAEKSREEAFRSIGPVVWECMIGNVKKWKDEVLHLDIINADKGFTLAARQTGRSEQHYHVEFSWDAEELTFSEVLEMAGKMPLPPYINREAMDEDKLWYQTVYATNQGSVAAPTAGLHFTERVFGELSKKSVYPAFITLHVGAGTFKPVVTNNAMDHQMHHEWIGFSESFIRTFLASKKSVVVGTTSLRALESLYWFGLKVLRQNSSNPEFHIRQWEAYEWKGIELPGKNESLHAVLQYMHENDKREIHGTTELMIVPTYTFNMCDYLVTNFHQPKSTLLLLVAAFYGDKWKDTYAYALKNNFRFLSYGDSCLFKKQS